MVADMKTEKIKNVSEYHSKELDKRLQEIQTKRNILNEIDQKNNFPQIKSKIAKERNQKILQELSNSQNHIVSIENKSCSNTRLKVMEKNYWSFVRSMKPLWEKEISTINKNY